MRISAKGRYALAAMITMARQPATQENTTVANISQELEISKIYLEQVFSLLKRSGLVNAIKGAQGGYRLLREPKEITAFDILRAVELSLTEPSLDAASGDSPNFDATLRQLVFDPLDAALEASLGSITLQDLVDDAARRKSAQSPMFYI
ncbi:MAG: Rrf2 family transcriptional regulator [Bacillota bacterium]